MPPRKTKRVTKVKFGGSSDPNKLDLTDQDLEDLVSTLWENIDALPGHIQKLLHDSQDPGPEGQMSFVLAAGWAAGKLDWVPRNFWTGEKAGWISKRSEVN